MLLKDATNYHSSIIIIIIIIIINIFQFILFFFIRTYLLISGLVALTFSLLNKIKVFYFYMWSGNLSRLQQGEG